MENLEYDMKHNYNNNYDHNNNEFVIDRTIVKMFLKKVKEGDLDEIKNELEKLNYQLKDLEDENEQNFLTYAALINNDKK